MASPATTSEPCAMDFLDDVPGHVFGRLVPMNLPAVEAFSSILEDLVGKSMDAQKPNPYVHAAQFMRAKLETEHSSHCGCQDNCVHPAASSVERKPVYTGSYILSLATAPRKGPDWILGSARGEGWEEEVDLVLDLGENHYTSGRHATIFFHPESHQLILHAIDTTYVAGRGGGKNLHNMAHVLEHGDSVIIGAYAYRMEFEERCSLPGFDKELWEFLKAKLPGSTPLHRSISAPSAARTAVIGNYMCSFGAFAKGSFGVIFGGIDTEGKVMAIKRFLNPKKKDLEEHKRIMEKIDVHENIMRLVDCFWDFKSACPGAYCVYWPLVTGSLRDILGSYRINFEAQVILFRDWVRAVDHLHSRGIMHRDLSWNNLGILLASPPKGVLLDLDGATDRTTSKDWSQGTLCFNAPEMITLKQHHDNGRSLSSIRGYDKAIDIFALGICGTVMLKGKEPIWWAYDRKNDQSAAVDIETKQKENFVKQDRYTRYILSLIDDARAMGGTQVQQRYVQFVASMADFKKAQRPKAHFAYTSMDGICSSISLTNAAISPKAGVKRSQPDP
ncbi:MAG: hypothetical protein Q9202_002008 [Teloschistes flavicans]